MNTQEEKGNGSPLSHKGQRTGLEHRITRGPEIKKTPVGYIGDMDCDGTVYAVIVTPVKNFGVKGGLGYVSDGFLVTNGLTRETYLFRDTYTDPSYWMEKTFQQYRRSDWLPWTDCENSLHLFNQVKEFIKNEQ